MNTLSQASPYYDALETRSREERESALFALLPKQIAHIKAHVPAMGDVLRDIDPAVITSRSALAELPLLRKSDLKTRQRGALPFGGLTSIPVGGMGKIFMSPGPIYEPEGRRADYWRTARALYAAGMRSGQILLNTFSYHLTPAGSMIESGALALGCTVIPAGTGNTEQQIEVITDLAPDAYAGTAAFLRILVEKFIEQKIPFPIRRAMTGGDALPASLRAWLLGHGLEAVTQFYGTADLGNIAYEGVADGGLVLDEDLILEIVTPGTGIPVAEGEVGEVVITTLHPEYPLLRFATGDLSCVLQGHSPCGRTNVRLKGWLGRADQTTKVRGLFVHPEQIALILKKHAEIKKARLVVSGEMAQDKMVLRCEWNGDTASTSSVIETVAQTVRDITKLRCEVELVSPGMLPNDGKVIEDARQYQ